MPTWVFNALKHVWSEMKSATFMISWHQVKGMRNRNRQNLVMMITLLTRALIAFTLFSLDFPPLCKSSILLITNNTELRKTLFSRSWCFAARSSIHYTDVDCWVLIIEQNSFYLPIECWFDNLARLYCHIRYNLVSAHKLIILPVFRKHTWFIMACISLPSTTIFDSDFHVRLMVVV